MYKRQDIGRISIKFDIVRHQQVRVFRTDVMPVTVTPVEEAILVGKECGSRQLEIQAWILSLIHIWNTEMAKEIYDKIVKELYG